MPQTLDDRVRVLETEQFAIMLEGDSDPNGVVEAGEGVFYWDSVTDTLYINVDGGTDWAPVGGTGSGAMMWQNLWVQREYRTNDVVRDGNWTMIANKTTVDRPAPQPTGDPETTYPAGDPGFVNNSQVVDFLTTATHFVFTAGGWIAGFRVWIPVANAQTQYRTVLINETNPITTVEFSEVFIPTSTGWIDVVLPAELVTPGTDLTVGLIAQDISAGFVHNYPWNYPGRNNLGAPAAGDFNRDNGNVILRINDVDDNAVNRSTELATITPGTTVNINAGQWVVTVNTATDQGTYWEFTVTTVSGGLPNDADGVKQISWTNFTAAATTYGEIVNYWVANSPTWATTTGILSTEPIGGGGAPPTEDNTGYGVDIIFIPGDISPDWDIVAVSDLAGSTGSGGSAAAILFQVFKDDPTQTISSSTFVAITSWATPTHDHAAYTFNETTGALTLNQTGTYLCSGWVLPRAVVTGACEARLGIRTDIGGGGFSGPVGQFSTAVINFDTVALMDEDTVELSSILLDLSAGDRIELAARRQGTNFDIVLDGARMTVLKVA